MTNPKLRRGRHSEVGAYYAVTAVCRRRQPFFIDPALAASVASQIQRIAQSGQVASLAWVIMPDHLHWLFRLRSGTLDRHIQALKSCSAITINRLRGGQGSIWQAGYYDHRLRSEEDLLVQARYVVANPLRAGLVDRIEEYPHWHCIWVKAHDDLFL